MLHYQKVLIATDMSKETADLINRVSQLLPEADIHLIHAIRPVGLDYGQGISYYIPDMERYERIQTELLTSKQEHINKILSENKLDHVTWEIEVGKPAKVIKSYANKNNIDLIILGTHEENALQSILGTTATSVLTGAPCDVLTIRL